MSRSDQKLQTRQRILEAAGRGFRKGGFGGVGVDGLAKEAGVTSGAFYVHFGSKAQAFSESVVYGMTVLKDGVLQQCDSPRELFTKPVNLFVAGFIGSPAMNLVPAQLTNEGATFQSLTLSVPPELRTAVTTGQVTIGFRPEAVQIVPSGGLDATVTTVEELGSDSFLYCTVEGLSSFVVARAEGLSMTLRGDRVSLVPDASAVHFFDTETGLRLPSGR